MEPDYRRSGADAYPAAIELLRSGEPVGVYPEATISRSFELKDFKTGVTRMALDTHVPIIPVVIWGVHRFWTEDHPKDLGRKKFPVNVRIGAPLPPVGTVDDMMFMLRDTMTAQLHAVQDAY